MTIAAFCPYCGASRAVDARFCSGCGKAFDESAKATPAEGRKGLPVIVWLPAMIVIGVVLIYLLAGQPTGQ